MLMRTKTERILKTATGPSTALRPKRSTAGPQKVLRRSQLMSACAGALIATLVSILGASPGRFGCAAPGPLDSGKSATGLLAGRSPAPAGAPVAAALGVSSGFEAGLPRWVQA